jgi:HEAT repeat protein
MQALVWLALAGLVGGPAPAAEEPFDLGPLPLGMQVLKLSTRDLRAKPEYTEDAIGGGNLRLAHVTDGLRGAVGAAARSRALGYRLTEESDLTQAVAELTALLSSDRVEGAQPQQVALPELPAGLPAGLDTALTELLLGVAQADVLLDEAFRALTPEDVELLEARLPGALMRPLEEKDVQAVRVAARVDMRALLSAAEALTARVQAAREALKAAREDQASVTSPEADVLNLETEVGAIRVAGTGPDVHTEPATVLIDLGGKDRYEIAAAEGAERPRVQVVIDLGGDDTYAPSGAFGPSAALLGLSVLVDEGGNDDYSARDPHAFGAAVVGAGLLIDAAGDDRYLGVSFGEGAAMFGLGLLLDGGGNDAYGAELYAQGFGAVQGVGALIDLSGTDRYQAGRTYRVSGQAGERVLACAQGFGLGVRGAGAPGGLGILADADGSDAYTADTYAQGAAWWFGGGLLFDRAGDDQYQAGQYSQGAGGFLGVGMLLDEAGIDRYSAAERAQGFGLERGIGLLRDAAGDDRYSADRLAQGAAMSSGIALALDLAGADTYVCPEEGLGFVPRTDAAGTLALFGDGEGTDSYLGPDRNNLLWSDCWASVGFDVDGHDLARLRTDLPATTGRVALVARQPTRPIDIAPTPGAAPRPADLEALWTAYQEAADARRTREAVRGFEAVLEQSLPYLLGKLAAPDEEQVGVAREILAEIGTAAVPELLRLTDEGTEREARAAMAVLTTIGDPRAAGHLVKQAKSPRWRTRAAAAGGMGALEGEDTRLVLEQLLRDTDEDVRRSAVVALRRRGEMNSAEAIAGLLGDPVYAVRGAAADALAALVALGARCPQHVFSLVGSDQPSIRLLSIESCGRLGSRQATPMLIRLLESPDWADRAFAAEAICRIGDTEACEALRTMLANEGNGIVLGKARTAMKATRLCEP